MRLQSPSCRPPTMVTVLRFGRTTLTPRTPQTRGSPCSQQRETLIVRRPLAAKVKRKSGRPPPRMVWQVLIVFTAAAEWWTDSIELKLESFIASRRPFKKNSMGAPDPLQRAQKKFPSGRKPHGGFRSCVGLCPFHCRSAQFEAREFFQDVGLWRNESLRWRRHLRIDRRKFSAAGQ